MVRLFSCPRLRVLRSDFEPNSTRGEICTLSELPPLIVPRIMGQITWACLHCKASEYRDWKPTYVPYDPAANMETFLSYLIRSKRSIHIHTVCAGCCDEKGIVTEAEQMTLITESAGQLDGPKSRMPWRCRRREFCCTFVECKKIMEADNVRLHIWSANSVSY